MPTATRPKLLEKRFPTILGLGILILALAGGIFAIQFGTGVFSPRANPESTPKNVKITNVTETGFTVSFVTDAVTTGYIKYGTAPNAIKTTVTDDRDQLAGNVGTYTTHHITVKNLQGETTYFFTIGTGSTTFDNNGQPYSIKTTQKISSPIAQTIYGTVLTKASTPAEGSIVYVTIDGAKELSTLVRSSGTWAIPLSQARTSDGRKSPEISTSTAMNVMVQGRNANESSQFSTTVGQPQLPVETITLGEETQPSSESTPTTVPQATEEPKGGDMSQTEATPAFTASGSAMTATPTFTPTPVVTTVVEATATPEPTYTLTLTLTPTPTEETTLPATDSAQPVSGDFANTIFLLSFGAFVAGLGSLLILTNRQD